MMRLCVKQARRSEKGSALVYILIAIALLALLTMSFMEPSSQQTSSQNTFKAATSLQGQADMIRAAIQECVLSYPRGDGNITSAGHDAGARDNYPINPDSAYYATATPARAGNRFVRNARCPGNNPGGSDVDDHEPIFSGATGKYLPPPPDLFSEWQIYNGTDGVFFWIETDKTDAFLASALTKLDENFSECEADVIDASSGAVTLDSDGDVSCSSDSLCFRVWMIMNSDTAVFGGDTDGEELAAGCDTTP